MGRGMLTDNVKGTAVSVSIANGIDLKNLSVRELRLMPYLLNQAIDHGCLTNINAEEAEIIQRWKDNNWIMEAQGRVTISPAFYACVTAIVYAGYIDC